VKLIVDGETCQTAQFPGDGEIVLAYYVGGMTLNERLTAA